MDLFCLGVNATQTLENCWHLVIAVFILIYIYSPFFVNNEHVGTHFWKDYPGYFSNYMFLKLEFSVSLNFNCGLKIEDWYNSPLWVVCRRLKLGKKLIFLVQPEGNSYLTPEVRSCCMYNLLKKHCPNDSFQRETTHACTLCTQRAGTRGTQGPDREFLE